MATMEKVRLETSNIEPLIGSAVHNDKATLLSGVLGDELRDLLEQRGVLVFPAIDFSDDEQIAFTKTLGDYYEEGGSSPYKITMDLESNPNRDYLRGAFYWHFDGFSQDKPIRASLLSGRKLAPEGGDTEFANTYAAYEALSDEDKATVENIRVIHTFENTQRYWNPEMSYEELLKMQAMGRYELPLVWKHASGRKSLVIGNSAAWIEGMDAFESQALLVKLRDLATQPRFTMRHKWTVGDLVIWDNTGTLHRATPYAFDSGRMMHRTKLAGEESLA